MVKAFFCKYIPPFESGSWNFRRLKLEVGIKLFFLPNFLWKLHRFTTAVCLGAASWSYEETSHVVSETSHSWAGQGQGPGWGVTSIGWWQGVTGKSPESDGFIYSYLTLLDYVHLCSFYVYFHYCRLCRGCWNPERLPSPKNWTDVSEPCIPVMILITNLNSKWTSSICRCITHLEKDGVWAIAMLFCSANVGIVELHKSYT